MADVDISYKGNVIASMNDSGTTTLETAGMYCEDDITVAYTKSGGGGGGTTCNLTISVEVVPGPPMPSMRSDVKYIDSDGTLQTITIDTGISSSETVTVPCPCIVGIGGETGIPYITGDAYMATYQYGYGATYVYGDATIRFSA